MHGYLGRANRKVIPACVVSYIRNNWPDPNENFTGYRAAPIDDEENENVGYQLLIICNCINHTCKTQATNYMQLYKSYV